MTAIILIHCNVMQGNLGAWQTFGCCVDTYRPPKRCHRSSTSSSNDNPPITYRKQRDAPAETPPTQSRRYTPITPHRPLNNNSKRWDGAEQNCSTVHHPALHRIKRIWFAVGQQLKCHNWHKSSRWHDSFTDQNIITYWCTASTSHSLASCRGLVSCCNVLGHISISWHIRDQPTCRNKKHTLHSSSIQMKRSKTLSLTSFWHHLDHAEQVNSRSLIKSMSTCRSLKKIDLLWLSTYASWMPQSDSRFVPWCSLTTDHFSLFFFLFSYKRNLTITMKIEAHFNDGWRLKTTCWTPLLPL